MKNKIVLKKFLIISIVIVIVFSLINALLYYYEYKTYTLNYNSKINSIVAKIAKDYPNVEKNDLIKIINAEDSDDLTVLEEYGIDLNNDSIILKNDKYFNKYIILNFIIGILYASLLITIFLKYNYNKDKKLKEITNYIEQINRKNYSLDIEDNTEDELSILKNEIYKTTVMLKEAAENSANDKLKLKDSLSDISHQLKTPLTSIIIMLDNILDNDNMDENVRNDFIKEIKKEITNIRFLVETLLKLSKFDSNSINFIKSEVSLKEIVDETVKKVSVLCDLKNIQINVQENTESKIICDKKWQVEALTNILKNCVEHSKENSKIDITYGKNKVYSEIIIKDYGEGIDSKELPYIFKRFYKCKNASSDSIGIGLSLAKSIIESNNGYIKVDSELNKGTTFKIEYIE